MFRILYLTDGITTKDAIHAAGNEISRYAVEFFIEYVNDIVQNKLPPSRDELREHCAERYFETLAEGELKQVIDDDADEACNNQWYRRFSNVVDALAGECLSSLVRFLNPIFDGELVTDIAYLGIIRKNKDLVFDIKIKHRTKETQEPPC
jgi:hypothetical protein